MKRAIVIGAGVAGLTSACELLNAGWDVTIVARETTPCTTSDIAAAFWFPYKAGHGGKNALWAVKTRKILETLQDDPGSGIRSVPLRLLQRRGNLDFQLPAGVEAGRLLSRSELPAGFARGMELVVPLVATSRFMPWLEGRFLNGGGTILRRTITSLEELVHGSEVLINCSGLGAGYLVDDPEVYPIRGQLVRVSRPAACGDAIYLHEEGETVTYVVPRIEDCVLGGTVETGNANIDPEWNTAEGILRRCQEIAPWLKSATVIEHRVGLRPGRNQIRVELEKLKQGRSVIHHYGHGGGGFTLAWGAAQEVLKLAEMVIRSKRTS